MTLFCFLLLDFLFFLLMLYLVLILIGPDLAEVKLGHQSARPPVLLRGAPLLGSSDSGLFLVFFGNIDNVLLSQLRHLSFQLPDGSVSLFDLISLDSDLLSQCFVLIAHLTLLVKSLFHFSQLVVQLGSLIIHILQLEVHQ